MRGMNNAHDIASAVGQAELARRIGVGVTAVNNAVSRGYFPATWFKVVEATMLEMGLGDCPVSAFNFKSPSTDAPSREAS